MRIDQKYAAIMDALNDDGHLQLDGEALHNGLRHTTSNKESVLRALHALETFDWCDVPQDLIRDLSIMQNPEATDIFENMQQELSAFSERNLMEAPPLEVLKEAVEEYTDDMFEVTIALERMSENFRLGQKTAELAESMVVEGQIKECVMGGSLVFGVEFPEAAATIWATAIYLMRKMVKTIQSGVWAGIRAAASHGRTNQAEQNAAFREGVATAFGDEIRKILEPLAERKGDTLHLAMEMHSLTAEGCQFEYSSNVLRTNKISIDGFSLEINVDPVSRKEAADCMEDARAVWKSLETPEQQQLPVAEGPADTTPADSDEPGQFSHEFAHEESE